MEENFEEEDFEWFINEMIDNHLHYELIRYKDKIEKDIIEGVKFKKSFKKMESSLKSPLDSILYDKDYLYLKDCIRKIEKDYAFDKLNKAAYSKAFQKKLKKVLHNLDSFMELHSQYIADEELLKFHYQNKAIFKRYFKIKYNDKLKDKVKYDDLKLCKGNPENNGITNDECNRLDEILNPQKKQIETLRLQKCGIELTTKDVAVFMILFKAYYKINFSSYVEFRELSMLIFDDLHHNFEAGDSKLGTSIKRYIKGEDLFAGNFDYNISKSKILEMLSKINLKDFKKYIDTTGIDKFNSLINKNTRF